MHTDPITTRTWWPEQPACACGTQVRQAHVLRRDRDGHEVPGLTFGVAHLPGR